MASGYSDLSEIRKDGRAYGLDHKPAKINLLDEKPRRESVIEQQLSGTIVRPLFNQPVGGNLQFQRVNQHQQNTLGSQQVNYNQGSQNFATNQQFQPVGGGWNINYNDTLPSVSTANHYNILQSPGPSGSGSRVSGGSNTNVRTITTTVKTTNTQSKEPSPVYTELVQDLAEKEYKLKRELAYINQHLSPWARPRQIREPRREPPPRYVRNDQRWIRECPSTPSSRPTSRASSTRSNTEADLMEKAAKLLQDAEEIEKKPLKTQQILIESGARGQRSTSGSLSPQQQDASSVHTAIIKVPVGEVDNKSPLPFAYDNFSTLGVRGNIASVGAAEPDKPYAPIFPIVKRTPSPTHRP